MKQYRIFLKSGNEIIIKAEELALKREGDVMIAEFYSKDSGAVATFVLAEVTGIIDTSCMEQSK